MAADPKKLDWSQLHPDLLQVIADRITEVQDQLRFRAVCTNWNSTNPSRKPQQFPWLLLPYHHSRGKLAFISNSKKKKKSRHYVIPQPPIPVTPYFNIFPFPNGWLVRVTTESGRNSLSLINPITYCLIPLPPLFHSSPNQINVFGRGSDLVVGFHSSPNRIKVFGRGSDLVVGFTDYGSPTALHFCRPGDSRWCTIHVSKVVYASFFLHRGCFLFFDYQLKVTKGFDMRTGELVVEIPPAWEMRGYKTGYMTGYSCNLVESPSGELLLVTLVKAPPHLFEVYRLDKERGTAKLRWAKVTSIGNCTIFWDEGNALCLDLNGSKGYNRNSIYFSFMRYDSEVSVGSFDIGKGRVVTVRLFDTGGCQDEGEPSVSFPEEGGWVQPKWFVPTLQDRF